MTELWLDSLHSLSSEQVKIGFSNYFASSECKFLPKPGQVIEMSGYKPEAESMLEVEKRREREYREKNGIS